MFVSLSRILLFCAAPRTFGTSAGLWHYCISDSPEARRCVPDSPDALSTAEPVETSSFRLNSVIQHVPVMHYLYLGVGYQCQRCFQEQYACSFSSWPFSRNIQLRQPLSDASISLGYVCYSFDVHLVAESDSLWPLPRCANRMADTPELQSIDLTHAVHHRLVACSHPQ